MCRNFSFDDFFSAFNSLRTGAASSTEGAKPKSCNSGCGEVNPQGCAAEFDAPDEDIQFNSDGCSGFMCRHKIRQPEPTCAPTCAPQPTCAPKPTCAPQPTCAPTCAPQPTCRPQVPQMPQRPQMPQMPSRPTTITNNSTYISNTTTNINNGIIDGPGNDIYDGPGDDVYIKNMTVNTYNTVNNFTKVQINNNITQPTVAPTIAPTEAPTTAPTDPPGPENPDDPVTHDLMPLRTLLNLLDFSAIGDRDGVLDDAELNMAMSDTSLADLDGNKKNISSAEMAIFNQIKSFNTDKELISNVIKGDYSNISDSQMEKLQALSDSIKELTSKK